MSDVVVDIDKMTDPKFVWNFCNVTNSDGSPFVAFDANIGGKLFTIRPTLTMLSSVNVSASTLANIPGRVVGNYGENKIDFSDRFNVAGIQASSGFVLDAYADGLQRMRVPRKYFNDIKQVEAKYFRERENGMTVAGAFLCPRKPDTHAVMVFWHGDMFIAVGLDLEPITTESKDDRN